MQQDTPITSPSVGSGMEQKNGKGLKIVAIVASIVAVCGVGFGVYGMVKSANKDSQVTSDLKVQVKNDDGTVTTIKAPEVETSEDNGSTTVIIETPKATEEDLSHAIYVAQWGIKIVMPETLGGVSYRFYTMPGYTALGVSGVSCANQGQCQYAPEFADLSKTNSPLGMVDRFAKGSEPTVGGGEKVTTIGDYDYYYFHPQSVYSTSASEVSWETESVNLIKEALTTASNYSAI